VYVYTQMGSAEVIRALRADGWEQVRQRGSHCQFRKPGNPNLVTVPHPSRDLPPGTLRAIEKASGLSLR
jgi:predicted RNA binding protein YcfA (HicA-like mRNA interferase family)